MIILYFIYVLQQGFEDWRCSSVFVQIRLTKYIIYTTHVSRCAHFQVQSNTYIGLDRPCGSRRLKLLEFLDKRHMKVTTLPTLRSVRLYPAIPRRYHWHSFLLEDESTPEPQCGRKD